MVRRHSSGRANSKAGRTVFRTSGSRGRSSLCTTSTLASPPAGSLRTTSYASGFTAALSAGTARGGQGYCGVAHSRIVPE